MRELMKCSGLNLKTEATVAESLLHVTNCHWAMPDNSPPESMKAEDEEIPSEMPTDPNFDNDVCPLEKQRPLIGDAVGTTDSVTTSATADDLSIGDETQKLSPEPVKSLHLNPHQKRCWQMPC